METRGAVMFTDEEYSKQADAVGLGMARPPRRAGRAKYSLSLSLMLSCPVMEGMRWRSHQPHLVTFSHSALYK